jgi:hypothetical protein
MTQPEKILCAAIWYKDLPRLTENPNDMPMNAKEGVVICGHRHANCIAILNNLTGKRSVTTEVGNYEQGFLTNLNRFVSREEGAEIAYREKQIIPNESGLDIKPDRLFSEDLY